MPPKPPATVPPPTTDLHPQTETNYRAAMRRFRELLLDAQQRRGTGKVVIEAEMDNGRCLDNWVVYYRIREFKP